MREVVVSILSNLGCLESNNFDGYNILRKQKELKEFGINIDLVFFNTKIEAFEYVLDLEGSKFKVEVYSDGNCVTPL